MVALVCVYFVLLLIAGELLRARGERVGFSAYETAWRLVACLVAIETVALALAVPFLMARAGWPGQRSALIFGVLLPVVTMEGLTVAAAAVATRGTLVLTAFAWAQLFLLVFCGLLGGLVACMVGLGCRPTTAQAVTSLLALAMVGNVFYANAAVEGASGPRAKSLAIDATLWTNPWLIAAGSILQADPLRSERLYSFSRIPEYAFRYPAADSASAAVRAVRASAAYAAVALVLWVLAWWRGRDRR